MAPKTRGSTEGTKKRKAEDDQPKQEITDRDEPKEETDVADDKPETTEDVKQEIKRDVKEEGAYFSVSKSELLIPQDHPPKPERRHRPSNGYSRTKRSTSPIPKSKKGMARRITRPAAQPRRHLQKMQAKPPNNLGTSFDTPNQILHHSKTWCALVSSRNRYLIDLV